MTLSMDSLRHGHPNQHSGTPSAGWTAVNRAAYQTTTKVMEASSGGSVIMQTTMPTMPMVKSLGNPFKMPVANTPRALLPRPDPVQRSQLNKSCPVCAKANCILTSHKYFAEHALAKRRSKAPATPTRGKATARPYMASPEAHESAVRYPVAMDAERHQLLSLWSQGWSRVRRGPERHLYPTRWIDLVLPTAMGHAPLFQALLATSASMWTMAHTTLNESTTRHLQLADQILSQTCTSQAIAAGDECLLAALLITLVHQAQGNAHETDKHFSNIVRLVRIRGGPYYLRMSGIVADVLLYVDYLQAVVLDCEPVWKLPLPALQIGVSPRLGNTFRGLVASNAFSVDLLQAADSVCRATDIFERPPEEQSPDTGVMNAFGYLSTISEYQLSHCNAVFHGSNSWDECICLALLIFNHTILRNDGVITASVRKLEHQFWQTVDQTITRHGFRDVPPCLLLWTLITGLSTCTITDSQYRPIAVKRMRAAKISAVVHGWEQFQQKVLDEFVWMQAAQGETFRSIWHEVEGHNTAF